MNKVIKSITTMMLGIAVLGPNFGMEKENANVDNPCNKTTTHSKLIFIDFCEIEQLSDGHIIIKENGEILNFTDFDKPHFKSETGEDVVEYSGLATDNNPERSWAKAFFEPGGSSPEHFHKERIEDYYVTSVNAKARVIIDGQTFDLSTGDHIQILPNQTHKVFNLSDENELSLFVKCIPSWSLHDHIILPSYQ